MGVDAAFRAKEMLCRSRIKFVERQRFRAQKDVNNAEIG
jgi:hypothetical protein